MASGDQRVLHDALYRGDVPYLERHQSEAETLVNLGQVYIVQVSLLQSRSNYAVHYVLRSLGGIQQFDHEELIKEHYTS
jgi:hypothetical protein